MWDTIGRTHLTTVKFPRLAVVPYAVVEWISKNGLTPNELRVWLEKLMKTDVDSKKDDWELFFAFSMAAAQMDPDDKKKAVSWPWKWNQSPSKTQHFGNGHTRDWMLH